MVSLRKLRAVYLVLLLATITSLVSANFFTDALGSLYGGLINLSASIKETADSAYHEAAEAKKEAATGETKVIVDTCDEIKEKVKIAKEDPSAIASVIEAVTSVLDKLGDTELTKNVKKNLEVAQDLIKLRNTADDAFAMESLQGIVELVTDKEEEELGVSQDVGLGGKLQAGALKTVYGPIRMFAKVVKLLVVAGSIILVLMVLIICFAVYYSIMKALAFLSVLWWLIKLPFRFLYVVMRFIWRLAAGGGGDSEDEANSGLESLSPENMEKECASAEKPAAPKKRRALPRKKPTTGAKAASMKKKPLRKMR